jgi:hypothetical protein
MNIRRLLIVCAAALVVALPVHAAGGGKVLHFQTRSTTAFAHVASITGFGAAGDTTACGMADSTDVLPTANFQRLYLWLKPNRPCRVAIQIRTYNLSDSAGYAPADSNDSAVWAWRASAGKAGSLTNAADSTSWIDTDAPTSVVAGEDEMVYEFRDTGLAGKWNGPRGRWIPICKIDNGEWYWGKQTSVRLRVLATTVTAAPSAVITWTGSLMGVNW